MIVIQNIKSTLILVVFCLPSFNGLGQNIIKGKYLDVNSGIEWYFEGGSFQTIGYENHGRTKLIKRGYYFISKDTLSLFFYPKEISKSYKIKSRRDFKSSDPYGINSTLKLRVINRDGKPIQGAIVSLLDFHKEPVISFLSNDEGKVQEFTLSHRDLSFLKISFLASQNLVLPLSEFRNASIEMEVILKNDSIVYSQTVEAKTYLVKSPEDGSFRFSSLDGRDHFFLHRKAK